jgi:hypothetical protein
MNPYDVAAGICAKDLVPLTVLRRIADRPTFLDGIARYSAMGDDDLLRATEVCLKNLERLDDLTAGPDSDLQLVLVPEIWERIRPGTRDGLRRISSTLAEYMPDPARPSIFARRLSPETMAHLREGADDLRSRIEHAAYLDVRALVEQVRFAIAGSHAGDRWSPTDCVYEPGCLGRHHVRARRSLDRCMVGSCAWTLLPFLPSS